VPDIARQLVITLIGADFFLAGILPLIHVRRSAHLPLTGLLWAAFK